MFHDTLWYRRKQETYMQSILPCDYREKIAVRGIKSLIFEWWNDIGYSLLEAINSSAMTKTDHMKSTVLAAKCQGILKDLFSYRINDWNVIILSHKVWHIHTNYRKWITNDCLMFNDLTWWLTAKFLKRQRKFSAWFYVQWKLLIAKKGLFK